LAFFFSGGHLHRNLPAVGWYFGKPAYGNLASIGALVILYFTQAPLAKRMVHLCICAFGFTVAFAMGSILSFNPYVSALAWV
jgi:uncharacterized membrane protein YccC